MKIGRTALAAFFLSSVALLSGCDKGGLGGGGSGTETASGGGGGEILTPGFNGDSPGGSGATSASDVQDLVNSCTSGGGTGGVASAEVDPGSGGTTQRASASFLGTTDACGNLAVALSVSNTNAFQVVTESPGNNLITIQLLSPTGTTLLSLFDDPRKTAATWLQLNHVNSLPYPSLGADPAVTAGIYSQQLFLYFNDGSTGQIPFTGTVIAKNDNNLESGTLRANIFLVGTDAQNNRAGIDQALDIWRTIYGVAGVNTVLSVAEFNVAAANPALVPFPPTGSDFYLTQSSRPDVQRLAVNVFIGDDVDSGGMLGVGDILGVASSIPGPAIPSSESAVAISLSAHEGQDGNLDPEDIDLLGETIAHESGHYLGLFHPVESNYVQQDPLPGTPECSSEAQCISNGSATNLMYWIVVLDSNGQRIQQRTLVPDQGQVLNFQAMVD